MTVIADSLPTALLALIALTTVRTSAAHLAVRAVLHPVLARPEVHRGSLPLRALRRELLSRYIRVLYITDIRNVYPDFRPPNRRRHPPPQVGAPRSDMKRKQYPTDIRPIFSEEPPLHRTHRCFGARPPLRPHVPHRAAPPPLDAEPTSAPPPAPRRHTHTRRQTWEAPPGPSGRLRRRAR